MEANVELYDRKAFEEAERKAKIDFALRELRFLNSKVLDVHDQALQISNILEGTIRDVEERWK